jgi:hypothetical protein
MKSATVPHLRDVSLIQSCEFVEKRRDAPGAYLCICEAFIAALASVQAQK